jgi:hypothetical protein
VGPGPAGDAELLVPRQQRDLLVARERPEQQARPLVGRESRVAPGRGPAAAGGGGPGCKEAARTTHDHQRQQPRLHDFKCTTHGYRLRHKLWSSEEGR